MMDAMHNGHPTPLTHTLCQTCIKFIGEVLNDNILWNIKIIFTKYLMHKWI